VQCRPQREQNDRCGRRKPQPNVLSTAKHYTEPAAFLPSCPQPRKPDTRSKDTRSKTLDGTGQTYVRLRKADVVRLTKANQKRRPIWQHCEEAQFPEPSPGRPYMFGIRRHPSVTGVELATATATFSQPVLVLSPPRDHKRYAHIENVGFCQGRPRFLGQGASANWGSFLPCADGTEESPAQPLES